MFEMAKTNKYFDYFPKWNGQKLGFQTGWLSMKIIKATTPYLSPAIGKWSFEK